MLHKTRVLASIVAFCFATTLLSQPLSKVAAISMVKNEIVGSDTTTFNIYMYPAIFTNDFCVTRVEDSIENPYIYSRLFFIDEMPKFNWGHNCSYIFIDTISGDYQRIENSFFPFDYENEMHAISLAYTESTIHVIPPEVPNAYTINSDPHKYALLFSGDYKDLRWNDLSHMYSALIRMGFSDDNIYVFKPSYAEWILNLDNDDEHLNDFDGDCNYDNIASTLDLLSRTMDGDDIFFFYCSTHGELRNNIDDNSYLVLENESQGLDDFELANMVQTFECSEMIFVLDACYSGGFREELEGAHRTIQTCTNGSNIKTIQGGLGYNTLTYAYATALKGFHPIFLQPWTIDLDAPIGTKDLSALCQGCWAGTEDVNPDIEIGGNNDGFIQTGEAFNYAKYLDPEIYNYGANYQNTGFMGDLLSLYGIEGRVDNSQNIVGNYLFGRQLTLSPGVTLSKGSAPLGFYLNDNTEILVEDGALLDIPGYTTEITGCSGESFVNVYGDIRSSYMHFTAAENAIINVRFYNGNKNYDFDHFSFTKARLSGICNSLSFTLSSFNNSTVEFSNGSLSISNSISWTNSTIEVSHPGSTNEVVDIYGNPINNNIATLSNAVIRIEDYPNFHIEGNIMHYDNGRGIELFNAGWDGRGDHYIYDNTIELNEISPSMWSDLGIHSYFSNAVIEKNRIKKNNFGIVGFHQSNLAVLGNAEAPNASATQWIADNTRSQCLFNYLSFPYEFKWNVISFPANDESIFINTVKYDELLQDTTGVPDYQGEDDFIVENNCWINEINMNDRLMPKDSYDWEPTWCPGEGHFILQNEPETMYYEAVQAVSDSNFTEAESEFKQLISEFPENIYAQASLKELFALNPALYDTNYSMLKTYTDSLAFNPGDSLLGKSAEWISIHCNIKNKEYQQAINSLDSILANPGTIADSIFALIDLSKVFAEMYDSAGMKALLVTQNPQVIPGSYKQFIIQRKEWIDLLLKSNEFHGKGDPPTDCITNSFTGKIISVSPIPFRQQVSVEYELLREGIMDISIITISGQEVFHHFYGRKSSGNYRETISLSAVQSGMLFLVLKLDGAIVDTEKALCN